METFSALLAICTGNSLATGEFPTQRPVTGSFQVSFDLGLNNPLSKHSAGDLRCYRARYDVIVMFHMGFNICAISMLRNDAKYEYVCIF